ncbi:cupredoxin domain-containing protein [Desulfurococcaceae archaeon AG1]|nr:cupredoxin domain-containing protein [Desulfurococcaceae archaeon AG1]
MSRITIIVGIVAVIIIVILAVYLVSPGLYGTYGTPQQPVSPTPTREIEVKLRDNYFEPQTITISLNETVRFVLKNEGRVGHTFTIDELGINVRLAPGETKTVEITFNKTGSYTFYCIPHKAIDMIGNLTIVMPAPKY